LRRYIFAVGGDRANATALVGMMNALFLREHNRLAGELERRNPTWDDTRVFETARNIVIVLFIKLVIEEYINHISSACFRLKADPAVAWPEPWNRPNWMTVEFSLLYRWHSLIPKKMHWDGKDLDSAVPLLDNSHLVKAGRANAFKWVSQTPAAKLDLHNTAIFVESGRDDGRVARHQAEPRAAPAGLQCLSRSHGHEEGLRLRLHDGDEDLRAELQALYGHPNNIDFYVALFAEYNGPNTPMPPLLGALVALDAFTQALNNPLLSKQVFNARTFTDYGIQVIEETHRIADLLARNPGAKSPDDIGPDTIRMTRADWRRSYVGL
jgi:prostaglandin-endoperoxide synthase 2